MNLLSKLRYHYGFFSLDKPFLKNDLPKLTKEEKRQICEKWPGLDISELDFIWSRIFKKFNGFSPYYIGSLWNQDIDCVVNPQNQVVSLENKALCDVYFPELNFPEPYVRCLNGKYYDKDMNYISLDEAIALLCEKGQFIIKPSIGTMQGKGVRKVKINKDTDIKAIILSSGKNFIAQEILKQLPLIEQLNPTSLNCFRITTMYFNGRFDYAIMLKVGKNGYARDNWNCSYLVNVDKSGHVGKIAYDNQLKIVEKTDNGYIFADVVIPEIKVLAEFVERYHKHYFSNCGIIGWDITIDANGVVRVIETNLTNPGTQAEQLCSGDFFRPFCKEINEALLKR